MLTLDAARAVLTARRNDSEVRREIAALLGRLDHGLPDEQVLEQLKTLRAGRSSSERSFSITRPNENLHSGNLTQRLLSLFKRRSSREKPAPAHVTFDQTNHKPNQGPMMICYTDSPIYIGGFNYRLDAIRWDLETLKAKGLLSGKVEPLREFGYPYCFGLGEDETLLSLARVPLSPHVAER